jgi:uncharacterized protein YdeI (YjbR/CyaY-like superfamily)
MSSITFFKSQTEFHKWLLKNHDKTNELVIGFYNRKSGKKGISYKEAVDEALCFGWIDGIRKNVDEESYMIRFTPRKKNSIWSNVNTNRVEELKQMGLMQPSGLKAFEVRNEKRAGIYSFEQNEHKLAPSYESKLKANKKAWNYFKSKAPYYQRTAIHWVMSAKQEATREKRLATLIKDSEEGRILAHLNWKPKGN